MSDSSTNVRTGQGADGRRIKVALLDDYQDVARSMGDWSRLSDRVDLAFYTERIEDREELVRELEPCEVVVAMRERTPFPRDLIERLPNLRLLITTGPHNKSFDWAALRDANIPVSATRFRLAPTVEITWALILACSRYLVQEDRRMREGGWQETVGFELARRTLGLVGLGGMGQLMVPIAKAFDMNVIAWSQNLDRGKAAALGVEAVSKERLFADADFISIHLVLSDRSQGLIGAADLERMKRSAFLVNTSRGPIVQEKALVDALQNGWIAGAGLDVYDVEPLPADHPLRTLSNVTLSPHIGFVSHDQYVMWYADIIENIESYLSGQPIRLIDH
ncbi:MAG: D-2-hydroxyacid dehydrogenase family protein [Leifsonia sp.]